MSLLCKLSALCLLSDPVYDPLNMYENYDSSYLEPVQSQVNLDNSDDEIYDDLVLPYEEPVTQPRPLPQRPPERPKANSGENSYMNLQAETPRKARPGSAGKKPTDAPPMINIFEGSEESKPAASLVKSMLNKEVKTSVLPMSVGSRDSAYTNAASERSPTSPTAKKDSTLNRQSFPNKATSAGKSAANSVPANPNKGRNLPSVPTEGASQPDKRRQRSPSPPVRSNSRSESPPAEGPGVRDLKKMFEK